MSEESKDPKKEKPVLLQAVHGTMVNPLNAQRFEVDRPSKVLTIDAWVQSQLDEKKLTDDI